MQLQDSLQAAVHLTKVVQLLATAQQTGYSILVWRIFQTLFMKKRKVWFLKGGLTLFQTAISKQLQATKLISSITGIETLSYRLVVDTRFENLSEFAQALNWVSRWSNKKEVIF